MAQHKKQSILARFFKKKQSIPILHKNPAISAFQNNNNYDKDLKIDSIFIKEYEHSSNRMIQILQERSSTFNLYFVLLTIIVSGLSITISQLKTSINYYLNPLVITIMIALGIGHYFFFSRFLSLDIIYYEDFIALDLIRELYFRQFQQSISGAIDVFGFRSLYKSIYGYTPTGRLLLAFLALVGSACFAGAGLVGSELMLHIGSVIPLQFPLDVRSYIIGIAVGVIVLLLQLLEYKKRILDKRNKLKLYNNRASASIINNIP